MADKQNHKMVFETLQQLEGMKEWSPWSVGGVLQTDLVRDKDRSDDSNTVFRNAASPPSPWSAIEFRAPAQGNGTRGMVLLNVRAVDYIPMEAVVAHFGKNFRFSPPDPRAKDEPTAFNEYKLKSGVLRVGFFDFERHEAVVFVLDRY